MIADEDPGRNNDVMRQSAMTAAERNQLMVVVNERAKLGKDAVRVMAADRLVEQNQQLEAQWEAEDFDCQKELRLAQEQIDKINERIRARLDPRGIPRELQPRASAGIHNAYVTDKRRAQLRQMLKDENEAAVRRAHHKIDTWKTDNRERLARSGLTSDAAIKFLDTLPDTDELLPKWLPRCYGARCVRDHWTVVGLWHSELRRALELPQLDEACVGCPVLVDILVEAA